MATELLYAFWGLLLALVPLSASVLGKAWDKVDRVFLGLCALAAFLLLGFAPRAVLGLPVAIGATVAVSAVLLGIYVWVAPSARARLRELALVIGFVDAAALAAIHLAGLYALARPVFVVALLAAALAPIAVAYAAPRLGKERTTR